MASEPPPGFWDRIAALHMRCGVSIQSEYPRDEGGTVRLRWIVRIGLISAAEAAEFVEVRNPSLLVAMKDAMDQAQVKGCTG